MLSCIYVLENFSLQDHKLDRRVRSIIGGDGYVIKDTYNILYESS